MDFSRIHTLYRSVKINKEDYFIIFRLLKHTEKEREQKEMVSEIKKRASNKFFTMTNNTSHSITNN